jgi:hypothetical protein
MSGDTKDGDRRMESDYLGGVNNAYRWNMQMTTRTGDIGDCYEYTVHGKRLSGADRPTG